MEKDMRLVNIYLKIYNKRSLTMDDLAYLAKYSPECFEKTCKNVIYNVPETKPIMEPEPPAKEELSETTKPESSECQKIELILENIKNLESNELPVSNIEAEEVKNLLGNLYMELLFPHNDKNTSVNMVEDDKPLFDRKI